jgi:hypothetical protein
MPAIAQRRSSPPAERPPPNGGRLLSGTPSAAQVRPAIA